MQVRRFDRRRAVSSKWSVESFPSVVRRGLQVIAGVPLVEIVAQVLVCGRPRIRRVRAGRLSNCRMVRTLSGTGARVHHTAVKSMRQKKAGMAPAAAQRIHVGMSRQGLHGCVL